MFSVEGLPRRQARALLAGRCPKRSRRLRVSARAPPRIRESSLDWFSGLGFSGFLSFRVNPQVGFGGYGLGVKV